MSYSVDLRIRVLEWIENGGSISKAAKIYKVGRATIYRWLNREDIRPTKVTRRNRKLDWEALKKDVQENPQATLAQRAEKFGVHKSSVHYALKEMKIIRKKNNYILKKET